MPTVIQWVSKLENCIDEQRLYAKPYEQRYSNEYVLPFIAQEYREVYGSRADDLLKATLDAPRTGAAAIGVDALNERLTVTGFESDDKATEKALNQAWEDNDLDLMHHHGHLEALIRSRGLGVMSRETGGAGRAVVTIESSEQAAVHRMPGPPYDVDGYLKRWIDEWTGDTLGNLRLYGRDIDLKKSPISRPDPEGSTEWSNWKVVDERRWPGPVPVVEFAHMPRLLKPPPRPRRDSSDPFESLKLLHFDRICSNLRASKLPLKEEPCCTHPLRRTRSAASSVSASRPASCCASPARSTRCRPASSSRRASRASTSRARCSRPIWASLTSG